jgi:hypothetical protein
MPTDPLSLKNLLLGGDDCPPCEEEEDASLAQVRKEIQTKVPNLSWADASREVDNKIDSVLDKPIDEMLVHAWSKYKELQKYCDADAYPPGKTVFTSLVSHEVDASFMPSVVIQVAGMDIAALELPITLCLELEGVVLKIDSGKILAIQAGSLQGVGTLEFRLQMLRPKLPASNLFDPIEKKTDKFDFPAAIQLDDGIPIHRAN